jgi:hypothetical protein
MLGSIRICRSYLYDEQRQQGRFALDEALGLINGYSPGVARWMCRSGGSAGGYKAAHGDLLDYTGLDIDERQIQRMVAIMSPRMESWRKQQADVSVEGAGEIFCVSADGTGAPMRREELRGRKGKQPDGSSRTREVKVGAVFTHRKAAANELPLRDHNATSYVAQITSAEDFGLELRAEALRCGIGKAKTVVFLGDGAPWLWRLARINFPGAVCILDFYHGAQHVAQLADVLHGEGSEEAKRQFRQWRKLLRNDGIDQLINEAKTLLSPKGSRRAKALKEIAYLTHNRSRMRYQTFRKSGYFIGSGVVEAACKSLVGKRLKQSGMFWGLKGAGHMLTIRCALLSGWFDDFWNVFPSHTPTLCATA